MRFNFQLAAFTIAMCVLGGCSLFHHEPTPEERFADALSRGNSMEAAEIWRNMTPDEKEDFAVNNNMKPDPEMEAQAKKQAAAAAQAQDGSESTDSSADSSDDDDGRSGKTLADFFHGPGGSKSSITDDDGKSGRTLEDYIPYMRGRTDDEQSQDGAAPASAPDASEPAQPADQIQGQ